MLEQARRAGQGQKADLGRRPRARPSAAGCGGEAGGGARRGAQTAHARSTDCARPRWPELDEDAAGSDGPKLCPTHTLVIGESGCPEGTSLPASVGAREGWGSTLEYRSANQQRGGPQPRCRLDGWRASGARWQTRRGQGRKGACQPAQRAFVSRNGVAYGMRRGKCRAARPDLDGVVRSEALTGSIAGLFLERRW